MRYLVRMFIVAVVIFVSVKNPNINVIGTVLGLISTQNSDIYQKTTNIKNQ